MSSSDHRPLGKIPLDPVSVSPSENPVLDAILIVLGSLGGATLSLGITAFLTWLAWAGTKQAKAHAVTNLSPALLWCLAVLGVVAGLLLVRHILRFGRWKRAAIAAAAVEAAVAQKQEWLVSATRHSSPTDIVLFSTEAGPIHQARLPSSYQFRLGGKPTVTFSGVRPRFSRFFIGRGRLELRGTVELTLPEGAATRDFTAALWCTRPASQHSTT
jgi:hypothetical protein